MATPKELKDRSHDAWLRRQALQIGSQLPENPADARVVVGHMLELIESFLDKPAAAKAHRKFGIVGSDRG